MKSLVKNQSNLEIVAQHATILKMQADMASACLQQGLKLTTTVGREEGAGLPYLQYAIAFNSNEPVVFHGQARQPDEPHYLAMFDLIKGKMVSEVFPPTIRSVQKEPEEGSNTPVVEPISYWKRHLVVEHDITTRDPDPKASQTDGLHKVGKQAVWVGYDSKSQELVRVTEGTANSEPENVDRVQYMEMGPRGVVVIVIYKDTKTLVEGQQGTFAESLKTAITGFQASKQSNGTLDQTASTLGGASLSSGPDASLSSATAHSSAAAAPVASLSTIDLSGMAVRKPALKEALNRLTKAKPPAIIDLPVTIKLVDLTRTMCVTDMEKMLRVAKEVGVKRAVAGTKLNQDQAKAIAAKFGFRVRLLTEDGGMIATKTPAAKKVPVKKPATKRTKA
ncbi:hypothetical protein [Ralstonia phage RSF1]|uniref:Uncharacterized protein n=1 Tax=Ralstonia phage RSF1 TaxID=1689679 RepID=A0A0K2QQS3_9CAUD|nr:hypothetical protein AVU11_gp140 [Ralstonia phage RSF1]BAS04932.2 hypothetical protein [Ralstonia phage RSF1]